MKLSSYLGEVPCARRPVRAGARGVLAAWAEVGGGPPAQHRAHRRYSTIVSLQRPKAGPGISNTYLGDVAEPLFGSFCCLDVETAWGVFTGDSLKNSVQPFADVVDLGTRDFWVQHEVGVEMKSADILGRWLLMYLG